MKTINNFITEKLNYCVNEKLHKINSKNASINDGMEALDKVFDNIDDFYKELLNYFKYVLLYSIKPTDKDVMRVLSSYQQNYNTGTVNTVVVDKDFLLNINTNSYDTDIKLIAGTYNDKIIFLLYHEEKTPIVYDFLMNPEDGYDLNDNITFKDWLMDNTQIKNINRLQNFFKIDANE